MYVRLGCQTTSRGCSTEAGGGVGGTGQSVGGGHPRSCFPFYACNCLMEEEPIRRDR